MTMCGWRVLFFAACFISLPVDMIKKKKGGFHLRRVWWTCHFELNFEMWTVCQDTRLHLYESFLISHPHRPPAHRPHTQLIHAGLVSSPPQEKFPHLFLIQPFILFLSLTHMDFLFLFFFSNFFSPSQHYQCYYWLQCIYFENQHQKLYVKVKSHFTHNFL